MKNDPTWPKCHFKPMTLHTSCSDLSGNSDGFECDYCGHTIRAVEWWDKIIKQQVEEDKQRTA